MEDLFDSQEKIDAAIADFTNLLQSPGWILYTKILDANIELIKRQLEEGTEEETKAEIDRLRDRLKVFKESRDKPTDMIKKLQIPSETPINDDPYYNSKEEIDENAKLDKQEKNN